MKDDCWYKIRNIWYGMRYRCYNEKAHGYSWYGERGIKICDKWLVFESFYEDMKDTWFPGATIDRIDSDDNYFLENCRWLSKSDNLRNANLGKSNQKRSETMKGIRSDPKKRDTWVQSLRGIPKSEEHKKKTSNALRGKKLPTIVCDICQRVVSLNNIKKHKRAKHG